MAGAATAQTVPSGSRWWFVFPIVVLVASGSIAFTIVSALVPHESSDRLHWWVSGCMPRKDGPSRERGNSLDQSRRPSRGQHMTFVALVRP